MGTRHKANGRKRPRAWHRTVKQDKIYAEAVERIGPWAVGGTGRGPLITVVADKGDFKASCSECVYTHTGGDMTAVTRVGMTHAREAHRLDEIDVHICEPDDDGFSGWMLGCSTT